MKAQTRTYPLASLIRPTGIILLVGIIFIGMFAAITLGSSLGGVTTAQKIQTLFGLDSTQLWWFITRAAGLTGYFLLWLSMAWGLAIPSKIAQPVLEGTFTYDFHEYLSLLGLGFVLLHIVVLLFDKYLPFTIVQLLIPFVNSYRPFWVGLGILSFYIFLVVIVTFYFRAQVGTKAFRAIHLVSLAGYLGTTLHGLFAGTDSALPVTMLLYAGTFLVIVFLTVYWLIMRKPVRVEVALQTPQTRHHQRR
jgi:methionine sulfoxide reductase heme-binding subunit